MKKILISLITIVIILILDLLFFKLFPFFIRPNLALVYTVFLALFMGHIDAIIYSFLMGLFLDFIYLNFFGMNTLLFLTIGYIVGWLNKRVNETHKKIQIIVLFFSSLLYFLLYTFFSFIFSLTAVKTPPLFFSNLIFTVLFGYLQIKVLIFIYSKNNLIT
ncbi:MAG: rod shape-determining protein MreD [Elusimicrobiota bacterium]|nr:rod shape-determining protein MreD [Endomicrobiia bacterium]MCX7910465.1 rod shape-determining protein MreD [Endomicrobiia bacterium]MDW8165479.1 rod shape-determining protein MreD [Elusimicrobiota bacterium]